VGDALRWLFGQVGGLVWSFLLWLTGLYDLAIAAWLPPYWSKILLSQRSHSAPLGLVMILALVALVFYAKAQQRRRRDNANGRDVKLPSMGGHFLWGLFSRHEKVVRLGGMLTQVRFDIAWRHVGILGTSGARKSTLLALLLEQIGKRYACLTGDHSPPLLNLTHSRGGIVWQARGDVGWYPWGGELEHAVQRVEHMFPSTGNDVGVHRSMFKQAARLAWAQTDDELDRYLRGVRKPEIREAVREAVERPSERARSVEQVMVVLPMLSVGASSRVMAENWNARLQELVDSLGGSLQTAEDGGFDLVEELAVGRDVMFALNSFADVSNRERFAKIAILEILRAADTVGNLSAAVDEVGLLGAELFAESVRTLRVRLCTGLFASHIAKDFPDVLKGLINVWFLGQIPGSDKGSRDWAAETTFKRVPSEHFGEHALPLGTFWLMANGRVQRCRVPTWQTRGVPAPAVNGNSPMVPMPTPRAPVPIGPHGSGQDDGSGNGTAATRRADVVDLASRRAGTAGSGTPVTSRLSETVPPVGGGLPAWLPADDEQLGRIYDNVELVGEHRLSRYRLAGRAPGRPQCQYNGVSWYPYALLKAVQERLDLAEVKARMADTSTSGLTYDHRCRELDPTLTAEQERRCQVPEHGQWRSRGGNTAIQWRRRAANRPVQAVR
jgi:hypothetical protein